jgi:thiamine biosynthesis protein ThiI
MKCVALLSSGIDSPVACYKLSSCIDSIILVHTDNRPYTDDREIENTLKLAKKLDQLLDIPMKLYFISHGKLLADIISFIPRRYTCVECKRMMLRYADRICIKESADAIVMGDSLGQVASQTLQNIRVIDEVTSLPIIRPLIGLDKEEIISVAKKIGTFNLSILPSEPCSAVPDKPATKAKLAKIKEIEGNFIFSSKISELVNQARLISSIKNFNFSDL